MPTLTGNYTFQFGDNGTVLNTDSMGTPFIDVLSVSGIDTAPLRMSTDEHQGMDGTYVDSPYLSMRTIVVSGNLYTDPNDPDSLLDSLRSDYNSNLVRPFYFQLPSKSLRYVNGQGGGLQYNIDTNRRIGITPVQFTVLAGDPYIYDWPPQQVTAQITSSSGLGMGFNAAFNLGFGGAFTAFPANVSNAGTHTAYPVISLFGPITSPTLIDGVSGLTMAFNIILSAGDTLVVDCRNKSVVLNGTTSRRSTLTGISWFSVPAGGTASIVLTAASGSGSGIVKLSNTYY